MVPLFARETPTRVKLTNAAGPAALQLTHTSHPSAGCNVTMSNSKRQRDEAGAFDLDDSPPPTPIATTDAAVPSRAARLANRAAQRRRLREAVPVRVGPHDVAPVQLAGEDEFHEPYAGTLNKSLFVSRIKAIPHGAHSLTPTSLQRKEGDDEHRQGLPPMTTMMETMTTTSMRIRMIPMTVKT